MSKSKSNTLFLNEKLNLIKCYEEEKRDPKKLVLKFKCRKTQIYKVFKNKYKIRLA